MPKTIPYSRQTIEADDIQSVVDVLKSGWITQGPKIESFEKALAKYCGAKYAVVVSNGTAALHLACLALKLKKGDETLAYVEEAGRHFGVKIKETITEK